MCFSPWTDLTGTGASVRANDGPCAIFRPENMADFAAAYLGDAPRDAPDASPLYADLGGLPPMLLHVGSMEALLDDARRVDACIRAAGGTSGLHVYEDVPHGWQMPAPLVPKATASLGDAAALIAWHLPAGPPADG